MEDAPASASSVPSSAQTRADNRRARRSKRGHRRPRRACLSTNDPCNERQQNTAEALVALATRRHREEARAAPRAIAAAGARARARARGGGGGRTRKGHNASAGRLVRVASQRLRAMREVKTRTSLARVHCCVGRSRTRRAGVSSWGCSRIQRPLRQESPREERQTTAAARVAPLLRSSCRCSTPRRSSRRQYKAQSRRGRDRRVPGSRPWKGVEEGWRRSFSGAARRSLGGTKKGSHQHGRSGCGRERNGDARKKRRTKTREKTQKRAQRHAMCEKEEGKRASLRDEGKRTGGEASRPSVRARAG